MSVWPKPFFLLMETIPLLGISTIKEFYCNIKKCLIEPRISILIDTNISKNKPAEKITSPKNDKESCEFKSHQKLTKDALETHNELSNQQKRIRSSSSSSIYSTSSTTSSSSTLSPRSKKIKRRRHKRPCAQVCHL